MIDDIENKVYKMLEYLNLSEFNPDGREIWKDSEGVWQISNVVWDLKIGKSRLNYPPIVRENFFEVCYNILVREIRRSLLDELLNNFSRAKLGFTL